MFSKITRNKRIYTKIIFIVKINPPSLRDDILEKVSRTIVQQKETDRILLTHTQPETTK